MKKLILAIFYLFILNTSVLALVEVDITRGIKFYLTAFQIVRKILVLLILQKLFSIALWIEKVGQDKILIFATAIQNKLWQKRKSLLKILKNF